MWSMITLNDYNRRRLRVGLDLLHKLFNPAIQVEELITALIK